MSSERILIIGNRNYSSWSLRGWLMLARTGEPFDIVRVALDTPSTRATLLTYSPSGRVPVLVDGERSIWDSLAIGLHLAERHPWLWPADRDDRDLAYSLAAEMHAGFQALRAQMPMNCRATGRRVPGTAELTADIERVVEVFESCPRGAPGWLFGEFTIADAMFAPVVSRLHTYGVAVPAATAAYIRHVLADELMAAWYRLAAAETEVLEAEELGR